MPSKVSRRPWKQILVNKDNDKNKDSDAGESNMYREDKEKSIDLDELIEQLKTNGENKIIWVCAYKIWANH